MAVDYIHAIDASHNYKQYNLVFYLDSNILSTQINVAFKNLKQLITEYSYI